MPQTTEKHLTLDQGVTLARAIMRLSSAIDNVGCRVSWTDEVEAARALALSLVPSGYDFRPRAPEPICDAPDCACADIEDCASFGMEEQTKPTHRVEDIRTRFTTSGTGEVSDAAAAAARRMADRLRERHASLWTLSWDGERFHVTNGIATGHSDAVAPDATVHDHVVAINALVRGMRLTMAEIDTLEPPVPQQPAWWTDHQHLAFGAIFGDIEAKIDGLTAKIDALAERKADETTRFNPPSRAILLKDPDLSARVTGDGASITLSKGARGRCFPIQELWDLPDVSEPLATMSGIQSRLNDLAKRLPHADAHMIRVVMPNEKDRARDDDTEVWLLDGTFDGHRAPFEVGDAITDSSAYHGIYEVLSLEKRVRDGAIVLRLKRHPGFVFDRDAF